MADLNELRTAFNEAVERRSAAAQAVEDAVDDEGLTEAEVALDAAEADVERCQKNIDRQERVERAKAAQPLKVDRADTRVQVTSEEPTYRRDSDAQNGFFRDLIMLKDTSDIEARDRLLRNNLEFKDAEKRAGLTQTATAGGEFVPPVWYVDQYAAKLRVGRPFLNALGTKPLPPNTNSLNFPKITTGASVAVQSDTGSVSNTDLVTTSVTAQVQTEAGRTVASYQTIDLGPITDRVIMEDLVLSYDTQIDSDSINGNVTNAKGIVNVSSPNTVTYTQATPTAALFFSPVMQAVNAIAKNAFVPTDMLLMHPSQWYFVLAGLDSNNRPLSFVNVGQAWNVIGSGDPLAANGIVGDIAGYPVCIDANVPTTQGAGTNQTEVFALNRRGFDFWESTPRFKVADQTSIATLQYQFVMYGYYAVTSRQAKMLSLISGTGLIVQSGF